MSFSKFFETVRQKLRFSPRKDDCNEYIIEDERISKSVRRMSPPKIGEKIHKVNKSAQTLACKKRCDTLEKFTSSSDKLSRSKHKFTPITQRKTKKISVIPRMQAITTPKLLRCFTIHPISKHSEYSDRKPMT